MSAHATPISSLERVVETMAMHTVTKQMCVSKNVSLTRDMSNYAMLTSVDNTIIRKQQPGNMIVFTVYPLKNIYYPKYVTMVKMM